MVTKKFFLSFIISSVLIFLHTFQKCGAQSGGLGFVGTYPEVIQSLVNALSRDETAKDEFIIHNQLTTGISSGGLSGIISRDRISSSGRDSPTLEITCEDEEGVTKVVLYSGQVYGYLREHRKFGRDFDLCCQFQWNDRRLPAAYEKQYMHLSRTWRGGGVLRNIYVGLDGIYMDEMLGGLIQNFVYRTNGDFGLLGGGGIGGGSGAGRRRDWLAGWDQLGNYGICEKIDKDRERDRDPDEPSLPTYLLGASGYKCAGMCRVGGSNDRKSEFWCYTVVSTAQSGGNWDYCSPNQDGLNNAAGTAQIVISSRGLRCKSKCLNYSIDDGTEYNYFYCSTHDQYSVDGVRKFDWDYCSPRFGFDYYNRECTNKCDYHGENYRWCWVKGGSWGYC